MPTLQKNSGATVDLWLWSSNNDLYYEGEAFTPKNGMWFNLIPVWGGNGSHEIIFDGNGGTGTIYSNGTAYTVNRISSSYRDGDTVGGHAFVYPGYTLTGFSTEQDGKGGTFYPIGARLRSRRTWHLSRSSTPSGQRNIILRIMYRWSSAARIRVICWIVQLNAPARAGRIRSSMA